MAAHPYKSAPPRAFWSRAVAAGFDPLALVDNGEPLIRPDEAVMSAGSCFAANLVPYLEREGFTYLRTEYQHPIYATVPTENLSYSKFSAGYGNIYTARQLLQLVQRALGKFTPVDDRIHADGNVIDVFRPGLRYPARSNREFELLRANHLNATLKALRGCDVFIFTLGLTEAWISTRDGAVYPACPGTIAGEFDPALHLFRNFTFAEVVADMEAFLNEFRGLNPTARVILTVSPVPLVATATDQHVVVATVFSKSILRAAAGELARKHSEVTYFPAYEIITGTQAPQDYFEPDRRNPSRKGVDAVMRVFLNACGISKPKPASDRALAAPASSAVVELARRLIDAECEEAMAEAP